MDKQLENLISEAKHMNDEAINLRGDLETFSKVVRQGLVQGMLRGFVMVVLGIIFSISILSYIGEPYACGTTTLIKHPHQLKTEVCKLVFPATKQQINLYKQAAISAKTEQERLASSQANKKELDEMSKKIDALYQKEQGN